jgi:beta-glucuronidase
MFTHGRKEIDLNGKWKFCPDPMQRCRRQKWWRNPSVENSVFPCWDRDGLWDIEVPGTWKTQFEELKWYDGHAVYMKEFSAEKPSEGEEVFLVFDGVVYESEIYLNGQYVEKHEWGYSAFSIRVTELIAEYNQLFVLVDNHLKPDRVPGEIFDWNNDGGIINPVKLITVPVTHVKNFRTETKITADESVEIDFYLEIASRDMNAIQEVKVRIPELDLEQNISAQVGKASVVSFNIAASEIDLWCPETPKLYDIHIITDKEIVKDEIGFREIKTAGTDILLNGEPIRLYGVSTHSEFKNTGRTATADGIAEMIKAAKDLGVNFLRCAHYPYSEEFGRAMDKAGIMWWEEVPAYWLVNMHEECQTRQACGMMEETVRRDWNRASLIIWSISNECCYRNPENFDDNNYAYWFKVVPLVKGLDPSRLVSCAEAGNMISINPIWNPDNADEFDRNIDNADMWRPGHSDEWYDLVDIFAANIYVGNPGEAEPAYTRFVNMLKKYNKPLMLSEFGSMSLKGSIADSETLGSEKRHSAIIKEAYEVFKKLPDLTGYCPWCLTDVRVPIHWRWYNEGKGVFRYGFMDENWKKKEVYNTLKTAISNLRSFFKGSM